jgi:hypothetical protein
MWRAEFDALSLEQAQQNEQGKVPMNASMLQGLGNYIDVNQQIYVISLYFNKFHYVPERCGTWRSH